MDHDSNMPVVRLTLTEAKCLYMNAAGCTDDEIGNRLALSNSELTSIFSAVLHKLDSPNRLAAIGRAVRLGMIPTSILPGWAQ